MNNGDINIDQNNHDYYFGHNRAAVLDAEPVQRYTYFLALLA